MAKQKHINLYWFNPHNKLWVGGIRVAIKDLKEKKKEVSQYLEIPDIQFVQSNSLQECRAGSRKEV